jgi:hypothetical protein
MTRGLLLWSLLLFSFVMLETTFGQSGIMIIDQGKSEYVIVSPSDAIPAEVTAARELQDYIGQMTGVKLSIVSEKDYQGEKCIAVGFNAKLPAALSAGNYGTLGEEELIIDVKDNTLLLAGGRPRGALYAVYEFLDDLGVRWYSAKFTKVPQTKSLSWTKGLIRYRPKTFARCMTTGALTDPAWAARNHFTTIGGPWAPVGKEWGCEKCNGPDMHTFWRIVDLGELQAHPEWWIEKDGKRIKPAGEVYTIGVCLGQKSFRDLLIARTMDLARKHPEWDPIWIGQNDTPNYCQCAECTKFYNQHGGEPSSMIVELLNETARQVAKEFPGRKVATLAYSFSLVPPSTMKLEPNALVMFCPCGDWVRAIEDNPKMAAQQKAIKDWSKITDHMAVYLYAGDFTSFWVPTPSTYATIKDIRWSISNKVDFCYAVISGKWGYVGGEWVDLRTWLYARMMWKPEQDEKQLIKEFCTDFYGPAGEAVYKVHELIHQNTIDAKGEARIYNQSVFISKHANPEVLKQANAIFEKAAGQMSLPRDQEYLNRLKMVWLPYLWADFWLGNPKQGGYDAATKTWSVPIDDANRRRPIAVKIKQYMTELGVNALSEVLNMNPRFLGVDKMGIAYAASLIQSKSSSAVVIPYLNGQIHEFKELKSGFTPFKEWHGDSIYLYPMQTTTDDMLNIGSAILEDYKLEKAASDQVILAAGLGNSTLHKEISIQDRTLSIKYSASKNNKDGKDENIGGKLWYMFNDDPKTFGLFPTIYIEMKDGRYLKHVFGKETNFWWIEGQYDLSQSTGKIILCSEVNSHAVIIRYNPEQLPKVSYWYDKNKNSYPADQSFMVKLYFDIKNTPVTSEKPVDITLSVEIIDDYTKIPFKNVQTVE